MNHSCIYLHFLDRELRDSMRVAAREDELFRQLLVAALFSPKPLYCSLSFLFETCSEFKSISKLTSIFMAKKLLFYISSHPTVQDFLSSRRSLYLHDAARYPSYFQDNDGKDVFQASLVWSPDRMTELLKGNLALRSIGKRNSPITGECNPSDVLKVVNSGLNAIGDKAVTFSAFNHYLPKDSTVIEYEIRRMISEEYTRERLFKLNGSILTGIPGLSYYDPFCTDYPCYDYYILDYLFSKIWHGIRFDKSTFKKISDIFDGWGSERHIEFCNICRDLISVVSCEFQNKPYRMLRHDICDFIKRLNWNTGDSQVLTFHDAAYVLGNLRDTITAHNGKFKNLLERIESIRVKGKEAIILSVANEIEEESLCSSLRRYSPGVVDARENGVYTCFDFLQHYKIYCVKSKIGSVGSASSELVISDAIDELHPKFVISCGVLFGMEKTKQRIGDVLVSDWIAFYEKQRVGEHDTIDRGDRITSSSYLLQLVSATKTKLSLPHVHFGGIVSGEKLVDNYEQKKRILSSYPEAIGGEMEGAGIVSACQRRGVQWLLIKGICDWGENKNDPKRSKTDDQKLAADNAVSLIVSMFSSVLIS